MEISTKTSRSRLTVDLRPPLKTDIIDLQDIDLKCFATPWEGCDWVQHGPECSISVASTNGRTIGFAAGRHTIEEPESFFLLKVGVSSAYRYRSVGGQLMNAMIEHAMALGFEEIHTVLAESLAYSVHGWLSRFGFKAKGIIKDEFFNYGTVEDGIRFNRAL